MFYMQNTQKCLRHLCLKRFVCNTFKFSGTTPINKFLAMETKQFVNFGYEKPVGWWLLGTAGMIYGIICFGGYTRLTESGLSMTDWKFQGRPMPSTDSQWDVEFQKYKDTLEYKQVHFGMCLNQFKTIYFNEWFHRMAARVTGIIYVSGFIFFLKKRVLTPYMIGICSGLLSLFLIQGLLGWWMVRSGFSERTEQYKNPRVSPYRLAVHLLAGTLLFTGLIWPSFTLLCPPSQIHLTLQSCFSAIQARKLAAFIFPLAPMTFLSGAFVAGNDAGRSYNTWPKMLNQWIPNDVYEIPKNKSHLFENIAVVQFDHRILAYATFVSNIVWYFYMRLQPFSPLPRTLFTVMVSMTGLQVLLGICTLLYAVPISLGVLHQALGLALLGMTLLCAHSLKLPYWWLQSLK